MALPIRPGNGLPVARPAQSLPDLGAMPELPPTRPVAQPAPASAPRVAPSQQQTPAPVQQRQAPVQQRPAPQPAAQSQRLPEGYAVDKATGKKYKKLPGFKPGVMDSKAAIKAASNGGMTLDQLRATVREDPDLNPDDLNGSAELFMSHLRVPPNKEEQKRLLEERAKREATFEKAYARTAAEDDEETE